MAVIDEAREFVIEKVIAPVLDSPSATPAAKHTARNAKAWLNRFERIGDLVIYMDQFQGTGNTSGYKEISESGFPTFEDIHDDFMSKFGGWVSEHTRLDDFVVGDDYSGSQLVIFARLYDNRSGGILRIQSAGVLRAVFVKATLNGGKYANEWIERPTRLKFFLKSRKNRFKETYVENAAIIENPSVPIYVFCRQSEADRFTFFGLFGSNGVHTEVDGSKWFDFARRQSDTSDQFVNAEAHFADFNEQVRKSMCEASTTRKARLERAPKKPKSIQVISTGFSRNPDVVAEVLARANGRCEGCNAAAPFERNKDGSPYLEVHHKTFLSEGGEDVVKNALALCPNCHRGEHFGPRRWYS